MDSFKCSKINNIDVFICPICNGKETGPYWGLCIHCKGNGTIDWIENICGSVNILNLLERKKIRKTLL